MEFSVPEAELFFLEHQLDVFTGYFNSYLGKIKQKRDELLKRVDAVTSGVKLSDAVGVELKDKDNMNYKSALQNKVTELNGRITALVERLNHANPRPYEDAAMKFDIFDSHDIDILKQTEDFKQGKLILGRAVTLPSDKSPEYAGHMWVQAKPTKPYFPYGLDISPIPRDYVMAKRGTTRDQRYGMRRVEYNETLMGAFMEFHKYCATFGKFSSLGKDSVIPLVFVIELDKDTKSKLELFNPRKIQPSYLR
jgi:hypothetical protein